MLVLFLALARNKVVYSFFSTLNNSYTLSFEFMIELECKWPDKRNRQCKWPDKRNRRYVVCL